MISTSREIGVVMLLSVVAESKVMTKVAPGLSRSELRIVGGSRVLLDILDVQEILSKFFVGDQIRLLVIMLSALQ